VAWELLVVNNNCTDATDAVLASFTGPLPLRRLVEPNQGVSHARNRAIQEASGDLLLWTDDDTRVDRDWLTAYVAAARAWPHGAFFGGSIQPWYACEPPTWVRANLETLQGMLGIRDFGPQESPFPGDEVPYGANMAFRRWVFENWRFNVHFGRLGTDRLLGGETTLCAYLRQRGLQGIWVPAARVLHVIPPDFLTLASVRRHFVNYGRTLVRLGDSHRTWFLRYPRWLCHGYCLLTRARIGLQRLNGRPNWLPLFARYATWEGILQEAGQGRVAMDNPEAYCWEKVPGNRWQIEQASRAR
jgi:glycosyltransferase involved in cell wall biosynthesis